ncbi:MAG: NAD(P)H-dependent oxidoreductase subunit E, partial [Planctomycetes bacterium]|nr:NAD(P)H-dependent oxidoreductase subunit E [Planctomycetota bacterium]
MKQAEANTTADAEAIDLVFVDGAVERIGRSPGAVIPILQAIQNHYRYLPEEALRRVCETTDITPAAIVGVSTFYTQFRHRPAGRHVINICHGTACHVKNAQAVSDIIHRQLNIPEGDDTDPDRVFTVEKVACLGCCTLAPVMQIDGVTYGHLDSPDIIRRSLRDFLELEKQGLLGAPKGGNAQGIRPDGPGEIRICLDSCCRAGGTGEVYEALDRAVRETRAPAVVRRVGCVLICGQIPLVEVLEPGKEPALYARVRPGDAADIVRRHFKPRGVAARAKAAVSKGLEQLLTDEAWEPVTRYAVDPREPAICEFIGPQKHIALEHYGLHDPLDIDAYRANGGFEALRRCLKELAPDDIIGAVERAGLRGRGGAGFPAARKWAIVRAASGDTKYIVCNGDEGDPGAFMDRMLLETFPFRVIEGIVIAARAVGAHEGYLYIRAEYPLAIVGVREAIRTCEERGCLGDNILGSGFGLRLHIMEGAGAFVCGEETALVASIEGRRG